MRHARTCFFRAIGAAALITAMAVSPSHAGASELAPLIKDLDAPDLETRNAAMHRLIELETPLDKLSEELRSFELTAEQRTRIDRAMFERFQRTPRAGMGVAFDGQFVQGVRLASVEPNFPAAKLLQPLDVITSVEGTSFNSQHTQMAWQSLRQRILSFDPGQKIPMEIRRGEQRLSVEVPLGSYEDLERASIITDDDYASAWAYRRARMGVDLRDAPRIEAPRDAAVWSPMTPLDQFKMEPNLGLLAGGTPNARPAVRLADMAQIARRNVAVQSRIAVRDVQVAPRPVVAPQDPDAVKLQAQTRRELLRQQIQQWEQNLIQYRIRAADPALTEKDRSQWAQRAMDAEARLAALREIFNATQP